MDAEMNTLIENDTWEIVQLPHDRTETKGKWVYTMKQSKQEGEVTQHSIIRDVNKQAGL
jgi:hypothetical protein